MNLLFVISSLYFSYSCATSYNFIWVELLFIGAMIWTANYALESLKRQNEQAFTYFCVMRIFIELCKLLKTVTILVGIDGNFVFCKLR